jgi:hypothetical protein
MGPSITLTLYRVLSMDLASSLDAHVHGYRVVVSHRLGVLALLYDVRVEFQTSQRTY